MTSGPNRKINKEKFELQWFRMRARGRSDLLFLAREVLQYRDIEPEVHGPIIEKLQKLPTRQDVFALLDPAGKPLFKGGTDAMSPEGVVSYTPIERASWTGACADVWHLKGYRKRLFLDPRGHLKALRIDTPIPTPKGFTAIGEIKVGDSVFGSDGQIHMVTGVSDVTYSNDTYEVEFCTGENIVCDGGHLWLTDARRHRDNATPKRPMPNVKTTEKIAESVFLRGEHNHRVRVAEKIQTEESDLSVPPYVLGAWLGDGTSATSAITIGETEAEEMSGILRKEGEAIRKSKAPLKWVFNGGPGHHDYHSRVNSLSSRLRNLGVIDNKHIPDSYMRSSAEQRQELLQGLMDTDGTISREGQCLFQNMNALLVKQVRELVCSLGIKCSHVYNWDAKLNGVVCGIVHAVSFYAYDNFPVFRLARKKARQPKRKQVSLQDYRNIVCVRRAAPCFVRCIMVDSPDSLYLAGEGFIPTHNTTLITIAHNIQWMLNYFDVRILMSMATGDHVVKVMGEVLNHFRFNETFRWLYPEYCPPAKGAKDFGNNDGFTVPNRQRRWMKEPTVSTCSIGKVVAGGHYEVICNSDLVDKANVETPNQIIAVKSHFNYLDPLLERGDLVDQSGSTKGWNTLEGTRYDDDDLYGMVEDGEAKLPPEKKSWQISVRAAENPDKAHPLWPRRFPPTELENLQAEPPTGIGIYQYAGQYLQKPVPMGSGLATRSMLKFKPRQTMRAYLQRLHMTVDLAGMDPNSTGDDTVLTTAGFDRDGRMNVVDVRCGRFNPFEVIEMLFLLPELYPQIQDIKVERESHARVFLPFVRREEQKRGRFLPPIIPIQRDNRTSKKQRIKGLQPFFMGELISFAEEIGCKAELILQITRFSVSSTYKDDILDTLADQLQNRDGGVTYEVLPGAPADKNAGVLPWPSRQFLGFDPETKHPMFWGEQQQDTNQWYHQMTGM